jgi:hypothetical protein
MVRANDSIVLIHGRISVSNVGAGYTWVQWRAPNSSEHILIAAFSSLLSLPLKGPPVDP